MEKQEILAFLQTVPLFAGVNETALTRALTRAETRFCAMGNMADDSGRLGVLLCGKAQILSADSGRTVILRTLCVGDVFGAAALFGSADEPISRLAALTDTEYLYFSQDTVRALLVEDGVFLDNYLSFLAGRVRFLNRKICSFTAGSAERRLALWLAAEEHDSVTLPATLADFADMLDIGRASLYRAFDRLAEKGFIARAGRDVLILDRVSLEHITQ